MTASGASSTSSTFDRCTPDGQLGILSLPTNRHKIDFQPHRCLGPLKFEPRTSQIKQKTLRFRSITCLKCLIGEHGKAADLSRPFVTSALHPYNGLDTT